MGDSVSSETKKQIKIAPSIIAADFTRLGEQVREAEECGADMIHLDVMDGTFVPNITLGPLVVEAVRRVTTLPLDVHLMIVKPENHIDAFAEAGANHITIHYEATTNVHRALLQIREHGLKPGVAINPHTPAHLLIDLMPFLDIINVMTVNPGFGGQKFLPETTSKIARLRAMIEETKRKDIDLEVDGGINFETARSVAQAGANVLVVGTYLFNTHHTVEHGMESLMEVLKE